MGACVCEDKDTRGRCSRLARDSTCTLYVLHLGNRLPLGQKTSFECLYSSRLEPSVIAKAKGSVCPIGRVLSVGEEARRKKVQLKRRTTATPCMEEDTEQPKAGLAREGSARVPSLGQAEETARSRRGDHLCFPLPRVRLFVP